MRWKSLRGRAPSSRFRSGAGRFFADGLNRVEDGRFAVTATSFRRRLTASTKRLSQAKLCPIQGEAGGSPLTRPQLITADGIC